jgi:hypothetical protein
LRGERFVKGIVTTTKRYRNFRDQAKCIGNLSSVFIQIGKKTQAACTVEHHAKKDNNGQGSFNHRDESTKTRFVTGLNLRKK